MSRKLYEKGEDIEREAEVLRDVAEAWHPVVVNKLPKKYALDAHLNFGTHSAFAEVKVRTVASTTFDTYMISLRKVLEGIQHASLFPDTGFLLLVRWTDGLFCCDVTEALSHSRIDFGGRVDRDDRQDMEPTVLIPVSQFVRIGVDK